MKYGRTNNSVAHIMRDGQIVTLCGVWLDCIFTNLKSGSVICKSCLRAEAKS